MNVNYARVAIATLVAAIITLPPVAALTLALS